MRLWWHALLMLSLISATTHAATVYKKVDKDGNLIFSDTPMDDAEEMDVPPVPTMKLDKIRPPVTPSKPSEKEKTFQYNKVTITAPAQDENFINNMGQVTVKVQIEPGLRKDHQVQLLLNGVKRAGPSASQSFSFSNMDRGAYSAVIQVVDSKGNVAAESAAVTFHVKRASRLN